jgi:ribulose bisphosphate carboxylase small subunit
LEENENGKIMVTMDTLRREKKGEIIRLAEMRGCRNVRVFGSIVHGANRPDSDGARSSTSRNSWVISGIY